MSNKSPLSLVSGVAVATLLLGYSAGELNRANAQDPAKQPGSPFKGADASGKGGPGKEGAAGKMNSPKGAPGKGGPGKQGPRAAGKGPNQAKSGLQPAVPTGLGPSSPAKGAPGAPGKLVINLPKSRVGYDPFKIRWHQLPPPPYIFDNIVGPVRIASVDVEIPPVGQITVHEVPDRRVSGIMSGDGVFAILESAGAGDTEIVKPGAVTKDGYRVVSITADSVKLERKDGNITRTQDVPLTDQSFANNAGGGGIFGGNSFPGGGGGGAFPGGPGAPGSGGFPGGPGARRGGVGRPGIPGVPGGGKGD